MFPFPIQHPRQTSGPVHNPRMSENFGMETRLSTHIHTHTCMFAQLTDTYMPSEICFHLDNEADIVSNSNLLLYLVPEVALFKETQLIYILQIQESRSYMKVDIWSILSPFLCFPLKHTFPSNGLVMEVTNNT